MHTRPAYILRLFRSFGKRTGITVMGLLLLSGLCLPGMAQPFTRDYNPTDTVYISASSTHEPGPDEYDEVMIIVNVPRIGSVELPAIVYQEKAYLPVKALFDYLKIWNTMSSDMRVIEGFFINPSATYSINKSWNLITYAGKKYQLQSSDMILSESGIYLKTDFFGQVFGLNCLFSFRSLTVTLNTAVELPALRELKMEAMHKNLSQLKNERKADTTIGRRFSWLRLGMLDWSVLTNQDINVKLTRYTFGVGAMVLGGETNIQMNLFSDRAFRLRDQLYFWRHVNNESKFLKQVVLGKILANPASTLLTTVSGIQFSNTPTTFRRSFGTYTLSEHTEPNWLVELYVNNVLVNFTRADASGFFTFEVPMVYGNSVVQLRYYGPYGEEKTKVQNLSIPFNFLPAKKLEYTVSAGSVDDEKATPFGRGQLNYGVNRWITVGGGVEYLQSVGRPVMPFVNTSVRLANSLFFNGEYIHGVRANALLSYRTKSNLRLEMTYTRFNKTQKAIQINFLEEKRLVVSKPFRGNKFSGFTRLAVNHFTVSNDPKRSQFMNIEFMVSAVAFGMSSNLTSFAIVNKNGVPLAFTNLTLTKRLKHGINLLPQLQYEYNRKQLTLARMEVEKSLFSRGFLSLSFERDFKNNNYFAGIGFRYNFSFAQASSLVRRNKQSTQTQAMVRGSVQLDSRTGYIGLTEQNSVGRGGLIVAPFLDLNCNNKRDKDEPPAPGLKMKINGGRVQRDEKHHTLRVSGLDAYTNYFVEFDKNSFDNIAWQIKKATLQLQVDPNQFTYLEVPVSVMGEVSGNVVFKNKFGTQGLGRIVVNIFNSDSVLVARTISESDGYFSYMGLAPGKYYIKVDAEQLRKLKMQCDVDRYTKELKRTKEGDAAGGLVFVLSSTDLNLE